MEYSYLDTKKYITSFVKGIIGDDDILLDGIPQVAFVGRSNVGKSSVINTLVGKKIAYPSATPGKTSEINFFKVSEQGRRSDYWYVVDLPGYGFARVSQKAADKFRKRIIWYVSESGARPKYVVLILDARRGITDLDKDMLEILRAEGHPTMLLVNKIDKLNQKERSVLSTGIMETLSEIGMSNIDVLEMSAQTGKGKEKVREILF